MPSATIHSVILYSDCLMTDKQTQKSSYYKYTLMVKLKTKSIKSMLFILRHIQVYFNRTWAEFTAALDYKLKILKMFFEKPFLIMKS